MLGWDQKTSKNILFFCSLCHLILYHLPKPLIKTPTPTPPPIQIISVNCTKGNKTKEVAVHVLISASSREWKLAWELTYIETKVYSFNNWNQSKRDHENQRPWEFVELGEDAIELLTIWHKTPILSHPPMLNHPRCSMGYNNTFYMTLFLPL